MRYWISIAGLMMGAVVLPAVGADIMVSVSPEDTEVLDWLDKGDLCELVEVHPGVTVEQLRALRKRGWGVVLQMMGHPESFDRRFIHRPGRPAPTPDQIFTQEEEVNRHIAGATGDATQVIWEFIMEEDSAGVAFPYRPGDRSMDGLFAAFFPGSTFVMQPWPFGAYAIDDPPASPFALSSVERLCVAKDDHVYRAPPPVPFGRFQDRKQAKRVMNAERMESSPFRPMADSRWGDIIDVLTDQACAEILNQYEVLILGGPIKVAGPLQTKIEAFVKRGGTLVWAAGMARPDHGALTGVTMQPEFRVGRAWTGPSKDTAHEPYLYFPAVINGQARVEVVTHTHNHAPLIVRNTVGKGTVYTCLSPWYASERAPLSDFALAMLDTVMASVQPITIEGIPVQWCSTRSDKTRTVAIANHSGETWQGAVCIKDLSPDLRVCREMRGQKSQIFAVKNGITRLDLSIPAYDVAVVRWSTDEN